MASDKKRQSSKPTSKTSKVSPRTIQQAKLIKIIESGNFKTIADAMRQAGYAESTINARAKDVIGNPRVQSAIEQNIKDLEKAGINRETLAERMALLLDEAEPKTVLATIKHAHKMLGAVEDKAELEVPDNIRITIAFEGSTSGD